MANLLLQLSLVVPLVAGAQVYEISKGTATSNDANSLCQLATPQINYKDNKLSIKDGDIQGRVEDNDKLWIGYAQKYTAFSYIGCFSEDDVSKGDVAEDPGKCNSLCMSTYMYIGIEEKKCYCLDSIPTQPSKDACDHTCSFPDKTLCGKKNKGISVYMPLQNISMSGQKDGSFYCRAYKPDIMDFVWDDCSTSYYVLCQEGYAQGGLKPLGGSSGWDGQMKACISQKCYPAQERDDIRNLTNLEEQHWIGMIRSYTIFKRTDVSSDEEGFLQGYVTKTGKNKYYLMFEQHRDGLKAVCNIGTESETTLSTQTTTPSSTTEPSTTSSISRATTTGTISRPTTATSSSVSSGGLEAGDERKGQALVAAYVLIPLVLAITAIVVVVIIWRKRKTGKRKSDHSTEYHNSDKTNVSVRNSVTNASYQDSSIKSQPGDELRHDYFVLEPCNEYAAIKDADLDDTVNGEYNTTKFLNEKANGVANETGNVYNRLKEVSGDTYNHTNTLNLREDDTYNNTCNGETDTTYNTTNTLSKSKNAVQVPENEYSQTNQIDDTYMYNHPDGAHLNASSGTEWEDTYNHMDNEMHCPKQVEGAYTFTKPTPKQATSSPDKGKLKYDYAYATTNSSFGSAEKPVVFKYDQSPNAGNYEFAQEPLPSGNYELAKPPEI